MIEELQCVQLATVGDRCMRVHQAAASSLIASKFYSMLFNYRNC